MPPNASNEVVTMPSGAAEKAVSHQNGLVTRTRLGETAYGSNGFRRSPASGGQRFGRFLEELSHTCTVEASPASTHATAAAPLADAAIGFGLGDADMGLWRFAGRAVRDGAELRCRLLAQAPPPRTECAGLSKGLGAAADAGVARRGARGPAAAVAAFGW